nr:hypothetical protein [Kluyvera intermedia]
MSRPSPGGIFFAGLTLDPPRLTIASENHNIRQTATSTNRRGSDCRFLFLSHHHYTNQYGEG